MRLLPAVLASAILHINGRTFRGLGAVSLGAEGAVLRKVRSLLFPFNEHARSYRCLPKYSNNTYRIGVYTYRIL